MIFDCQFSFAEKFRLFSIANPLVLIQFGLECCKEDCFLGWTVAMFGQGVCYSILNKCLERKLDRHRIFAMMKKFIYTDGGNYFTMDSWWCIIFFSTAVFNNWMICWAWTLKALNRLILSLNSLIVSGTVQSKSLWKSTWTPSKVFRGNRYLNVIIYTVDTLIWTKLNFYVPFILTTLNEYLQISFEPPQVENFIISSWGILFQKHICFLKKTLARLNIRFKSFQCELFQFVIMTFFSNLKYKSLSEIYN